MDYQRMGQRIRTARRRRRLTQEKLSEMANISPAFMGHIERGNRIPSVKTLVMLCRALQVEPNELLSECVYDVCDHASKNEERSDG